MSKLEKVTCPYCGAEMCVDSYFKREAGEFRYFCHCYTCGSMGPDGWETEEKARAAAMKRYRPAQKPLALKEVMEIEKPYPLWWESKKPPCLRPVILINDDATYAMGFSYGLYVRYWLTKPTDAEREAAKWEG